MSEQSHDVVKDGGEEDGGQVVGDFDFGDAHQVGADHDDQNRAGAGHFVDGTGAHEGGDEARQQNQAALDHQDGHGRQQHACAQAGGKHHGGHQVQHGFGDQDGMVPRQARLDGAGDGHGAHAEQQCGGDETFRQGNLFAFFFEFVFHLPGQGIDGAVDIQQRAGNGAQHHRRDEDQHIFAGKAAGNADIEGTGTQTRHGGAAYPLRDALAEQQADTGACEDCDHIDDDSKHIASGVFQNWVFNNLI